ncbi:MAG TPA: carbamoyltransferase HypF [Trebonia sp.]|nr:carbamoyltransferase HypF [Trebonia sp.]
MEPRIRTLVRVEGVVQGVGFRPFVYSLATRLGLAGHVGNDSAGVFIEVEGSPRAVLDFLASLERDAPALARIEAVRTSALPPGGGAGFSIAASDGRGRRQALVSADSATCDECLAELADPGDRRFGYPFINCTNCGPRFTIVRDVPYDRPLTTMAGFGLCAECAAEYDDPVDRRFHAQPVCCPACGPRLRLTDAAGGDLPGDPIAGAADLLASGQVLAVKGLGGYHLAVDAGSEPATASLRERKHREDKPFALMAADLAAARLLCEVDSAAATLLASGRRPIVLLPRRSGAPVAPAVAPGSRQLGVMLPYTPLHHLLVRAVGRPLVLTSGNISDEPIAYDDEDARARLAGIADYFLVHDRPIHMRTDDSVVRGFRGREMVMRRSRGYAPEPIRLRAPFARPVLGCGAELKNTFCLGKDDHAFVSHHIGDLENYETLRSFTDGIAHFRRLFDVTPEVVAHDLHPEYLSTKYALDCEGVELVAVQHHHAHIASCLADNGEDGPVIGVAFDGTGYGTDGTIWGGEFLIADLAGFTRAGFLAPVPLPGGTAAIRQPWRMAASYLSAAYPQGAPGSLDVARRNEGRWDDVLAVARSGINSPLTSSAGRLFDAAASVLGVRDAINYEGQAAIELEQLADPASALGGYPAGIEEGEQLRVAGADLIRAVAEDVLGGAPTAVVASRFHHGVADAIGRTCAILRSRTGLGTVALSGGVFQNLLLLDRTVSGLEASGFRVLVHARVPPNDGGISLGQAAVAAARDRPLLRVFVRGLEELPGHYPHGDVTRLERSRRDGGRVDLDERWELRLGPDDLSSLAEPTPDSDHAPRTTRRG